MGINRGAVIGFASMCGPGGAGLVVVDLLQLSGQATARWWLATQRRHKNIERQGGNKTNPLLAKIPMGTRPLYLWWLLLVWGLWRDICRWLRASKTAVTTLLTQWSYRSLPLSHRYLVWYISRTPKMERYVSIIGSSAIILWIIGIKWASLLIFTDIMIFFI